jgi:hypothetical protein
MSNKVIVYKNRTNTLPVNLGIDITGDTLTSEIRVEEDHTSDLIAAWTVIVDDAATGLITLTLDNSLTDEIEVDSGYMDIKRVTGGEPVPVFDRPLQVVFQGTVTA